MAYEAEYREGVLPSEVVLEGGEVGVIKHH